MKFIKTVILLCIPLLTFSQYRPLENLNLESGEFCVLAKFSESDPSSLRDSLGEFYISDIDVLKELQEEWKFEQEAPFYACGYHYSILICKNGKAIDGFSVNLNCNTICGGGNCFNFDNNKLRLLLGKTKTFHKIKKSCSIEEGRKYLDSIKDNSNLIFAPEPIWMSYEGDFEFTFNYPEGTQEYYPDFEDYIDSSLLKYSSDSILAKLKLEIENSYPKEDFTLENYGGSLTTITVKVTCNKSLEEKFNLYDRNDYQKWEYFKPSFRTYWFNKPKKIKSQNENQAIEQNNSKQVESSESNKTWLFILIATLVLLVLGIILKKRHANKV